MASLLQYNINTYFSFLAVILGMFSVKGRKIVAQLAFIWHTKQTDHILSTSAEQLNMVTHMLLAPCSV